MPRFYEDNRAMHKLFYELYELSSLYFILFFSFFMFSYDLEFTVAHNLVAVSTGSLLYQVAMNDIDVLGF